MIRKIHNLQGINIPASSENIKIIQHMDDTTVMVNRDEDFNVLTSILNTYSEGSGSRINNQKTTGLWLGKWKKKE